MPKIRFLNVQFDAEVRGYEIPAFRAAVIEKAGRDNIAFHNHLTDHEFAYGYPVIQYKKVGGNPAIICVDYGVDEIHHFFQNQNWDIRIGERVVPLVIKSLQMNQFNVQIWEKRFEYEIRNWLALNQENHLKYGALTTDEERHELLRRVLVGNHIALAKGIKWDVDKPIELHISDITHQKQTTFKGTKLLAFDLRFSSNVFLPDYIGLGKGVSHGFGTVRHLKKATKK
jgi:Cas6b C-terminal domain/Cas6b N-terminal domain